MLSLILAIAAQSLAEVPAGYRLPPVEQCRADPSFDRFRLDLRRVIARKDAAALKAMLADDVTVDFGGGRGIDAFISNWALDARTPSPVWDKLKRALAFGCAPAGNTLAAPSFVTQFPSALDVFETVIAIPQTRLRTRPDNLAPSVGNLDWHLLRVVDEQDPRWLGVTLLDGRRGFVRSEQVISPLDFRATFEKRGDHWMITSFLAGD